MKHYKGPLGEFSFDPEMYQLEDGYLRYVGGTHYGCIKSPIPEGIKICDYMFDGNYNISVGPVLPKSCTSANFMFRGCTHLVVFPDINLNLMQSDDFDCRTVFNGCTKLTEMCMHGKESIDPWVCACERSTDYDKHVQDMRQLASVENARRKAMYGVRHPFKQFLNKKNGVKDDVQEIKVDRIVHSITFDAFPELNYIIEQRKKGITLGIIPKRNHKGDNMEKLDAAIESASEEVKECGSSMPEQMRV